MVVLLCCLSLFLELFLNDFGVDFGVILRFEIAFKWSQISVEITVCFFLIFEWFLSSFWGVFRSLVGKKVANPWEPHVLYVKYPDFFGPGCLEGTRPEGSGSIFERIFGFPGVIFV